MIDFATLNNSCNFNSSTYDKFYKSWIMFSFLYKKYSYHVVLNLYNVKNCPLVLFNKVAVPYFSPCPFHRLFLQSYNATNYIFCLHIFHIEISMVLKFIGNFRDNGIDIFKNHNRYCGFALQKSTQIYTSTKN